MPAVIARAHCLRHPTRIIRLFGVDTYFGLLFDRQRTLLQRVTEKYQRERVPIPGPLGDAYRLATVIELRMARIYQALAKRFAAIPEARQLFDELAGEEREHARVMLACLYHVRLGPDIEFIPDLRDPEIRALRTWLRSLHKRIHALTLDQALELTLELERSEINTIFERLLRQVRAEQLAMFAEHLVGACSHSESIPRRIASLRTRVGEVDKTATAG